MERYRNRDGGSSELPKLYDIFLCEVATLQPYGIFVRIPGFRKNGLVHKTQMSKTKVDDPSDMVEAREKVYCKVITIDPDTEKIGMSMKVVNQTSGQDLDPGHVQTALDEQRRKTGHVKEIPRIELGAVLDTTCKKCGGKGHLAKDCFHRPGSQTYDLLPALEYLQNQVDQEKTHKKSKKEKKMKKSKKKNKKEKKHKKTRSYDTDSDSETEMKKRKHKAKKRKRSRKRESSSSDTSDSSNSSSRSDSDEPSPKKKKYRDNSREERDHERQRHRHDFSPTDTRRSNQERSADRRPSHSEDLRQQSHRGRERLPSDREPQRDRPEHSRDGGRKRDHRPDVGVGRSDPPDRDASDRDRRWSRDGTGDPHAKDRDGCKYPDRGYNRGYRDRDEIRRSSDHKEHSQRRRHSSGDNW